MFGRLFLFDFFFSYSVSSVPLCLILILAPLLLLLILILIAFLLSFDRTIEMSTIEWKIFIFRFCTRVDRIVLLFFLSFRFSAFRSANFAEIEMCSRSNSFNIYKYWLSFGFYFCLSSYSTLFFASFHFASIYKYMYVYFWHFSLVRTATVWLCVCARPKWFCFSLSLLLFASQSIAFSCYHFILHSSSMHSISYNI